MATELFANRRQDIDVRHTSAGRAADILADLDE
jgi:sulfate adenylyltransferase subunit 1